MMELASHIGWWLLVITVIGVVSELTRRGWLLFKLKLGFRPRLFDKAVADEMTKEMADEWYQVTLNRQGGDVPEDRRDEFLDQLTEYRDTFQMNLSAGIARYCAAYELRKG